MVTEQEHKPSRRGRPPGPSLASQAVQILSRNAFIALRGPNSRGAVPRTAFDGIDVSTVDRSVKREFGSNEGRTPFDLATRYLFDLDTSGLRATMRSIYEAVNESLRESDDVEAAAREFLRVNFLSSISNDGMLASFVIQTAACAHLERQEDGVLSEVTAAAAELIEIRQKFYDEMTEEFAAALTIILRRLRRRPKPHVSVFDIVIAITAANDGFVILHKLHPARVTPELVVDSEWNIGLGLSEPGLLDPPDQSRPIERALVEAALSTLSCGVIPSIEELAEGISLLPIHALKLFPNIESVAQRCMDYAIGSSIEIHNLANGVQGAELAAIRNLLMATSELAETSPVLIDLVTKDVESGFCAEVRRHISEALSHTADHGLTAQAADGFARMLLDAALQGKTGEPIWKSGLEALAS